MLAASLDALVWNGNALLTPEIHRPARKLGGNLSFFSRPRGIWLARRFGPKVTVEVNATEVVFRRETWSLSLEPALFVRDGVIVSVGVPAAVPSERLKVFSGNEPDRTTRIAKFMQYGLWEAIGHKLSIRPIVHVAFDPMLVSETELRSAFLNAGAAEVTVV